MAKLMVYRNDDAELLIKIVSSEQELAKAFMIRAIVYMHEQECPYEEEFDLNDYTCTHIIGLIGNEPVLTARIRYFADFVKFERLAVRQQYRGKRYAHLLLKFMLDLAVNKGYRNIYLHAQSRLQDFYAQYGFKKIRSEFKFSDYDYVEMLLQLECSQNDHTELFSNPMIINRPEGRWNLEGPLDKSLNRFKKVDENAERIFFL